jgi:hypothetical protein
LIDLQANYWPSYCEENVWHLCRELPAGVDRAFVAFISNADRQVAIGHQRSASSPIGVVVWDYHVILLIETIDGRHVLDADSTLDAPTPLDVYLSCSFRELPDELSPQRPRFRLIEAAEYRRSLRTDRRHMRKADGSWRSPPPPTPCIGVGSNLMRFVDMERDFIGDVHDLASLRRWAGIRG